MMIRNVTERDLMDALAVVNVKYDGNIQFKTCKRKGRTRDGGEVWSVTLRPIYCTRGNRGVRIGQSGLMGYGRIKRIAAACWHVHGDFFDALPKVTQWPCTNKHKSGEDVARCVLSLLNGKRQHELPVMIRTGSAVQDGVPRGWFTPGSVWVDFNIGSRAQYLYASEACDCEGVK